MTKTGIDEYIDSNKVKRIPKAVREDIHNIFNNKLVKYINPFNYQENLLITDLMIHKSKTDGYKAEQKSKEDFKEFKEDIIGS